MKKDNVTPSHEAARSVAYACGLPKIGLYPNMSVPTGRITRMQIKSIAKAKRNYPVRVRRHK